MNKHNADLSWLFVARLAALALVCLALAACSSDNKGNNDAGLWTNTDATTPYNGLAGSGGTGGIAPTGGTGGVAPTGGTGGVAPTGGTGGVVDAGEPDAAGTGGTPAPDAGEADAEVDAGTDAAVPVGTKIIPARCTGDANKTAMIGDSYLALSGNITKWLQQSSGQTYRAYYVSGTQMVGGIPPNIPDQGRAAIAAAPTQTFIMDGGGNDVLLGDLSCWITGATPGSACEATVLNVLAAAGDLLDEVAGKGVEEVIYFFYPRIPNQMLAQVVDYAAPKVKDLLESETALDATFIDTRDAFDGHPEYIEADGIHPTDAGAKVIAGLIWAAMEKNCTDGIYVTK